MTIMDRYAALNPTDKFWVETQAAQALRAFPSDMRRRLNDFPNTAMWELVLIQLEHSKAHGQYT